MKLYIIFPGALFPIVGMSQVRMLNQLISLSKDHQIVFSDRLLQPESLRLAREKFKSMHIEYKPVFSPVYEKGVVYRAFNHLLKMLSYHLTNISTYELALRSRKLKKQFLSIANSSDFDAVMIHYWYLGDLLSHLDKRALRLIDTHYVEEESIEVKDSYVHNGYQKWQFGKILEHSLKMQRKYFLQSDLLIVNSPKQKELIHAWNADIPVQVTINGQDLKPFLNFTPEEEPEQAVCFYGSLSNQFNRKALQRILESIYPAIKASMPETKLYIIGANPPMELINPFLVPSVIITGFVEDIKPFLTKCRVMLLPIETGAGFRGRIVEAMALGIPVVGTENAVQSVGFLDGQYGFMEETNEGIVKRAVELLKDDELRKRLAANCRECAKERFSLDATFGMLSQYLLTMRKREH